MRFGTKFLVAEEGTRHGDGAAAAATMGHRLTRDDPDPSSDGSFVDVDGSKGVLNDILLRGFPAQMKNRRRLVADWASMSAGEGTVPGRLSSADAQLWRRRGSVKAIQRSRHLWTNRLLSNGDDGDPWKNYQHPTIHQPTKNTKSQTSKGTGDDDGDGNGDASNNVDDAPTNGTDDQDQGSNPNHSSGTGATSPRDPSSTSSPYPDNQRQPQTSASQSCHSLPCRAAHTLTNPVVLALLAAVALYAYVRRRARRLPSHGAYRAVAAHYVNSAFDEELSPDDYLSDDEEEDTDGGRDYWSKGQKRTIEMGSFKDDVDLTLDELNG